MCVKKCVRAKKKDQDFNESRSFFLELVTGVEPAAPRIKSPALFQHELKRHEKTTMEPFSGHIVVKMECFSE